MGEKSINLATFYKRGEMNAVIREDGHFSSQTSDVFAVYIDILYREGKEDKWRMSAPVERLLRKK